MGDDLGYKTSTMLEPDTIRKFILPQYKRVIDIVHASGKKVLEEGSRFRAIAHGYGLGSGNSIPDYMSIDGFNAMVDAAFEIRKRETVHFSNQN